MLSTFSLLSNYLLEGLNYHTFTLEELNNFLSISSSSPKIQLQGMLKFRSCVRLGAGTMGRVSFLRIFIIVFAFYAYVSIRIPMITPFYTLLAYYL